VGHIFLVCLFLPFSNLWERCCVNETVIALVLFNTLEQLTGNKDN